MKPLFYVLTLGFLFLSACQQAPDQSFVVGTTLAETISAITVSTSYPTYTPYPTFTPQATYTAQPTFTPIPTFTPTPIYIPSHIPLDGFTTLTDKDAGYAVDIPNDWIISGFNPGKTVVFYESEPPPSTDFWGNHCQVTVKPKDATYIDTISEITTPNPDVTDRFRVENWTILGNIPAIHANWVNGMGGFDIMVSTINQRVITLFCQNTSLGLFADIAYSIRLSR